MGRRGGNRETFLMEHMRGLEWGDSSWNISSGVTFTRQLQESYRPLLRKTVVKSRLNLNVCLLRSKPPQEQHDALLNYSANTINLFIYGIIPCSHLHILQIHYLPLLQDKPHNNLVRKVRLRENSWPTVSQWTSEPNEEFLISMQHCSHNTDSCSESCLPSLNALDGGSKHDKCCKSTCYPECAMGIRNSQRKMFLCFTSS